MERSSTNQRLSDEEEAHLSLLRREEKKNEKSAIKRRKEKTIRTNLPSHNPSRSWYLAWKGKRGKDAKLFFG